MAEAFLREAPRGVRSAAMRLSTRIMQAVRATIDFVRATIGHDRRPAPVRVRARDPRFR